MTSSGVHRTQEYGYHLSRTVFIDNLSPLVTLDVLQEAVGQFGHIITKEFLNHDLPPYPKANCALLEMASEEHANNVVKEFDEKLFMLGGLPRPITATIARPEHCPWLGDGEKVVVKVVDERSSDGKCAFAWRALAMRHLKEMEVLREKQKADLKEFGEAQTKDIKSQINKIDMLKKLGADEAHVNCRRMYGIDEAEVFQC
eukprot:TRINITY_DN211_c1_g2_i1.p1 TRINITY_DN211_c1_g2~~TRINITY_DN211_c1_g2_i1.p1  ORF type:complete len:201 (-),score=26.15 TRINITY_DN211_c1_g2_i1:475-1077(-)